MMITYVMMQYPLPTQTFAMSDIAALRSLGHQVTIQCLLPATRKQKVLMSTYNLKVDDVRNMTLKGYLLGLLWAPRYVLARPGLFMSIFRELVGRPKLFFVLLFLLPRVVELTYKLVKSQTDVVHAFWGHWPSIVAALVQRYAPHVRTSVHMGAYDLYAGFPLRLTANVVDDRFTHSVSNLPRIRAMGVVGKVHMVHRGVPLADLLAVDSAGAPVKKVRFQFCTASALSRSKNVDNVLRVFGLVRNIHPQSRLLVVGDGEERGRLERLAKALGIEDAVVFLGYLKREELFKVMCSSESFIFLSQKISERLPNVVKEAMLARCCCFVSDTQGIEELVPGPDYGLVLKEIAEQAVAGLIGSVVSDESRIQQIGDNGHSRVLNHFSVESAMRRYVEVWRPGLDQALVRHGNAFD